MKKLFLSVTALTALMIAATAHGAAGSERASLINKFTPKDNQYPSDAAQKWRDDSLKGARYARHPAMSSLKWH